MVELKETANKHTYFSCKPHVIIIRIATMFPKVHDSIATMNERTSSLSNKVLTNFLVATVALTVQESTENMNKNT
jgi:hypothetical protein